MHLRHHSLGLNRRFIRFFAVIVILLFSGWAVRNEITYRSGTKKLYGILRRKGFHTALTILENPTAGRLKGRRLCPHFITSTIPTVSRSRIPFSWATRGSGSGLQSP